MVTSRDITPQASKRDWSLELGSWGVLLAAAVFGGVLWSINGGFSVLGLETVATSFNQGGAIFWALIALWQVDLPNVSNIPASIPALPWLGVLAASVVQFSIVYRKLKGLSLPRWLVVAGLALSLYDFATTFFGLSSLNWLDGAPTYVRGALTLLMAFGFELIFGVIVKEVRK
jgi:hypothetical protein